MARRVEEIKRVRRDITEGEQPAFEEEFYDVGERVPEETGLNTTSGVLALLLLALAIYLIWAALT